MSGTPFLAGYPLFCLVIAGLLGSVLWKLICYVRLRIALLAVSKIPGPPSQSFWSGERRIIDSEPR